MAVMRWAAVLLALGMAVRRAVAFCEGSWRENASTTMDYSLHAYRVDLNSMYFVMQDNSFKAQMCMAQQAPYTCYMNGPEAAARAEKLERRLFVPESATCQPFRPVEFLELLRNKRLIVLGDSISSLVFASIFCALYPLAQSQSQTWWHQGWHNGFLNSAEMTFTSFNVSLKLLNGPRVDEFSVEFLYSHFSLSQDDIVIFNYGLHYNDKNDFGKAMHSLREIYLKPLYNYSAEAPSDAWRARLPPIFFLEATPQHFPETANGYFAFPSKASTTCAPQTDRERFEAQDWRNRVREEVFPYTDRADSPVKVVPLVHGLWDQHGAHVGRNLGVLDCTHWCFPSGVNKFFLLMLHNTLLQHVDASRSSDPHGRRWVTFSRREGDLVKTKSDSAVYLLQGAQRRVFNSMDALTQGGFSPTQVVTIENWEMKMIPIGPPIVAHL